MDIKSNEAWPSCDLSNFASHPFVFDGVEIASMEGFLQALKFSNPEIQRDMCKLIGFKAKKAGKLQDWKQEGKLYWQGQEIDRFGQEYQDLLDRVYDTMFEQSESVRKALLATGDAILEHSIGRIKASDTILTREEFCSRLIKIRNRLSAN